MRNLALLNTLWDGGSLTIDRRKIDSSFTVRGARLTIGLQVQEATLREFLRGSDGLARGSGWLARFLPAWPESTQGFRPFREAPEHWPALAAFNRRMTEILNEPVSLDDDGGLSPSMLSLSPEAMKGWRIYHDGTEIELASGGDLHDVRDVASKSADNAARLAALFHYFEGGRGAIGAEAMKNACTLAKWHLNEARRFYGELTLPAELADAARLDTWLIDHCRRERTDTVPVSAIQKAGPGRLRSKAAMESALVELQELGRARLEHGTGKARVVRLNPALFAAAVIAVPAVIATARD